MLRFLLALIRRDLALACRRPADLASPLCFFLVAASLFPLGVGAEPELLRRLAPGVLWVSALFSTMLSLPRMFADDFADGALEQLALAPSPFVLAAFGKMLAHWLLSGLPLAVMSPVLGLQFGLPPDALFILLLTLLAGTPALSSIGAIGAALTLGLRGGGALLALLVLPLYIPVLVFGAGAVDAVMHGIGTMPYLLLLSAGSLASLALAPLAAAAALKLSLE